MKDPDMYKLIKSYQKRESLWKADRDILEERISFYEETFQDRSFLVDHALDVLDDAASGKCTY
jgi:hypothetical protein